jgi:hypothetical protein
MVTRIEEGLLGESYIYFSPNCAKSVQEAIRIVYAYERRGQSITTFLRDTVFDNINLRPNLDHSRPAKGSKRSRHLVSILDTVIMKTTGRM